ncbi:DUF6378 domain-containing protein [Algiphilus sp. W345]|uniref:DUF6378 domain-containing protein n=1 Tax=Banduia mediterranea TaxID=3075609 RepID=A0ABU2WF52_9GAMM|nr:DUF6378 domain-containing protein [Algiphilus sp. W345]MDT0496502.1 DUF6378 domain-containing protein [Algiphilus sp. W345]
MNARPDVPVFLTQQPPPRTGAQQILQEAIDVQNARAATRDTPGGERSMARTVAIFAAMTDIHLSEEEGWMFMVALKAARAAQGAYNRDDYVDGASYLSLAGESAGREPKPNEPAS